MSEVNKISPAFSKNCVPIVFCCNDSYIKILSVAIQSVIDNSSIKNNYDILIFYTNIKSENKKIVESQFVGHSNFSCRFINVTNIISNFDLVGENYITKESYYRLLIIDILKVYPKVVYLDCDLIVNDDIANLFKIDISNYYLGACRDMCIVSVMRAPYGFALRPRFKKMQVDYRDYFNAGVLLFNPSLIHKNFTSSDILKAAEKNRWKAMDQDALNVFCQKKVFLINVKWNMGCHRSNRRLAKYASKEIRREYKEAFKKPSIYHFYGPKKYKPWLNPFPFPSFVFWRHAYKTPFYQVIVGDMLNQTKLKFKKNKMIKKVNEYVKADRKSI